MEDAQVGDRELQAITEMNKCTRTIAMTVQVDLGSFRATSTTWSTEPWARQSWSEIATRVSWGASSLERAYPTWTEAIRAKPSDAGWLWSSGTNRLECASVGYTLKETELSVVCVEISALSMFWFCSSMPELSRTSFADARQGPSKSVPETSVSSVRHSCPYPELV